MKIRAILKAGLGIGTEVLYALAIMLAAYLICILLLFKR